MTRVPEILDIQDDLQPARETAEHDIDEDVENVLDLLQTYEDREYGDRQGLLDRIDEELLRLEEQVESDHTRLHLQAARNRIRIYRDTMSKSATDIGITTSELTTDTEDQTTLHVTILNEGEPTTVTVTVTFYDEDFTEIETARSEPVECDADTEETIDLKSEPPNDYAHYVPAVQKQE